MRKILYIHHAAYWGGAPKSMIETIKSLDKSKYCAQVLLLKNSVVADKLKDNDIPYILPQSKFYQKYYIYFTHSEAGYVKWFQALRIFKLTLYWILSRFIFAKRELDKIDFDIVHLNSSVLTDWLAPCAKRTKTIIHIREPFRKGKFDILHYFFRHQMKKYADRIIAISNDNAKRVNLLYKTTVVYNCADSIEKPPSLDSYQSKKFLYLGGASLIKGFYTLVDALDFLDKNVIVIFAGNYEIDDASFKGKLKKFIGWRPKYRKAIAKMKNHSQTQVVGMVDNIYQYIDGTCCVISAFSKPHFSRAVIEAHLRQKPAIGSNVEGMDEIIEHGINGFIVEKDNPRALAEAINEMSINPELVKRMGEVGYKVAIGKFSSDNIKSFQRIYDGLREAK